MKILASILNVALLVSALILIMANGMPRDESLILCLLVIVAPIFSLIYIASKSKVTIETQTFLSLYLQRKSLEEKKKIKQLQTDLVKEV